jgi:hypothetical protein
MLDQVGVLEIENFATMIRNIVIAQVTGRKF